MIAADNYFNLIQQTIASYSTGDTELGEKLKSYASRNIAATREFLKGDEPSERIARDISNYATAKVRFGEQTMGLAVR